MASSSVDVVNERCPASCSLSISTFVSKFVSFQSSSIKLSIRSLCVCSVYSVDSNGFVSASGVVDLGSGVVLRFQFRFLKS